MPNVAGLSRYLHRLDRVGSVGMTVDQVLAAKLTADSEASIPQGAQTAEQFVRWLYTELTRSQQSKAGSTPK